MIFNFEQFPVYKLALEFARDVDTVLSQTNIAKTSRVADQLIRASLSISLNIAEGAGRFHKADKKNFYIIARGSVFECVAIFDLLQIKGLISKEQKKQYYSRLEELSKMLSGLINSYK